MSTKTTASPALWVGWARRRGERWAKLIEGHSFDSVLGALLEAQRGGDKTVLPAGVNPNQPRQPDSRPHTPQRSNRRC